MLFVLVVASALLPVSKNLRHRELGAAVSQRKKNNHESHELNEWKNRESRDARG
jgi:hypothetical protein